MQAPETRSETEKPQTRVDVDDRVRNTNSSSALDFSGRTFENHINLAGYNFGHAKFVKVRMIGARFVDQDGSQASHLAGADFSGAQLEEAVFKGCYLGEGATFKHADLHLADLRETDFRTSDLRGANLTQADLSRAKVFGTKLEGAYLGGSDLNTVVGLESADWGSYRIGEEIDGVFGYPGEYIHERFLRAGPIYRSLRYWHIRAGVADRAAEFYYREMECLRKHAWKTRNWLQMVRTFLSYALFGYGERPERTIVWALAVIFIFSFLFSAFSMKRPDNSITSDWFEGLYLSAVSFTALGYGSWALEPLAWGRFLGVIESFLGVFTMALFVTLFVRKMAR